MREQALAGALQKARGVPPPVVWIASDEPLLMLEAADLVRAAVRGAGFDERHVFHADRSFRLPAPAPPTQWSACWLPISRRTALRRRRWWRIASSHGAPT